MYDGSVPGFSFAWKANDENGVHDEDVDDDADNKAAEVNDVDARDKEESVDGDEQREQGDDDGNNGEDDDVSMMSTWCWRWWGRWWRWSC